MIAGSSLGRATVSLNGSDVDKCSAGTDSNKFPGA